MSLRFVASLAAACAVGCGTSGAGSPFAAKAEASLIETITRVCADPRVGSLVPAEVGGGPIYTAQSDGICQVRLSYDVSTLEIRILVFGTGSDEGEFRRFLEGTVLSIVKAPVRMHLEKYVLADLGTDKKLSHKVGGGRIDYERYTVRATGAHAVELVIEDE